MFEIKWVNPALQKNTFPRCLCSHCTTIRLSFLTSLVLIKLNLGGARVQKLNYVY